MVRSGNGQISYQKPNPFVLPNLFEKPKDIPGGEFLPPDIIPRETLHYAASALEEIMFQINVENEDRDRGKPIWKKYLRTSPGGSVVSKTINPSPNGVNLRNAPVKFFPLYVRDIQNAIDSLIGDTKVPDTRQALFARNLANSAGQTFNSVTKLKNGIKTPNGILNPLASAIGGSWPFRWDTQAVINVKTNKPVSLEGNKRSDFNFNVPGAVETTDPEFPEPEVGARTPSGVAGFDGVPMTPGNAPNPNRRNVTNTSQGFGAGLVDLDQGYGYLAHIPHVVQQLRYQPPRVEWWPNFVGTRTYTPNIVSNTTPNLPWVLSQPVETQFLQNWGFWLINGKAGFPGLLKVEAFNTPSAQEGGKPNCPFSVFYPPPSSVCSCGAGHTAYAIWWSETSGFKWNSLGLFQGRRAQPILINKNTRLKMPATLELAPGDANSAQPIFNVSSYARILLGIRTVRIGHASLQPFWPIGRISAGQGIPDLTSETTANISLGDNLTESTNINVMEAMNEIHGPSYPIGGYDFIEAIQILCENSNSSNWICVAQDFETGTSLPDGCFAGQCVGGITSISVNYIAFDEVSIQGDPVDGY